MRRVARRSGIQDGGGGRAVKRRRDQRRVCRAGANKMASENHSNLQPGDPTTMIRPASTSDQGQPSSPKSVKPLVQDLPDELVQAGWSKCWSRRENRPYYFNKFTNQSLWEMPVFGQHDIIAALKMGQEVEMKSGLDGPEHQDKMVDGPATQNEKTFGRSVRPGGMD